MVKQKFFVFSSEEKRQEFLDELAEDAKSRLDSQYYWNRNWDTIEISIDPKPVLGN